MWVALGEPVTTIAVPLWMAAGVPPDELWQGKDAPIRAEAARLKAVLRPLKARERNEYPDLTRLDNASGTGWLPGLLAVEREIASETDAFLRTDPPVEALAAFQKKMAARALAALKAVEAPPRAGADGDGVAGRASARRGRRAGAQRRARQGDRRLRSGDRRSSRTTPPRPC